MCFGAVVCLHFGRNGFNPLDQSIVFDGGWRILSGQVPFRDFSALTGTTPSVVQALFFRIFGVNWFAYCLHAAFFNGLFCVLVYWMLRVFRLPVASSFFYALCSGLAFYTPVGTPYMEQHGFFFLLVTMLALVHLFTSRRVRTGLCLGVAASLSFVAMCFSKQNVALFAALPLLTLSALFLRKKDARAKLGLLTAGAGLALLLCWLATLALGISLSTLELEFIRIPLLVGGGRFTGLELVLGALFPQNFALISVGLSSILFAASPFALRGASRAQIPFIRKSIGFLALAASLEVACMLFARNTVNQKENAFPFLFLSLGFLDAAVRRMPAFRHRTLFPVAALALLTMREAVQFRHYDAIRSVADIVFEPARVIPFRTPELQFMRYQIWDKANEITAPDLDRVIDNLRRSPDNFFLLGDYSILYGLTGKPSVLPSLWIHEGLVKPAFQRRWMSAYESHLLANLHRYRVKTIVLEGSHPYFDVTLRTFPAVQKMVTERTESVEVIGPYRLIHLNSRF